MFDIFFLISLLVFSILCFVEFIVFNEEILLALCFFSFFFFCFNSLGSTVFDIFHSRAAKFEADLLISFDATKQSLVKLFENYLISRGFGSKFKILSLITSNYLNAVFKFSAFKLNRTLYSACAAKLSELLAFEAKLLAAFQKKSVSLLLYPLIFQTVKNNLNLLTSLRSSSTLKLSASSAKTLILKSIS
jgi:hypothetical protein